MFDVESFGDPGGAAACGDEVANGRHAPRNINSLLNRQHPTAAWLSDQHLGGITPGGMQNTDTPASEALRSWGERLKTARKARGMTQTEVAGHLGLTTQVVSTWEKGRNWPLTPNLITLKHVLGVSIDWLLVGDSAGLSREAFDLLYKK